MKAKLIYRNQKFAALLLFLLIAFACSTAFKKESVKHGNIEIIGDKRFILQTQKALALLKEKDHKAYFTTQKYLGLIVLANNSGVSPWKTTPTYEVGSLTAYYGLEWYASTIAHEAIHSKLYHDYLYENPEANGVPDSIWLGEVAEVKCLEYQRQVLKKLGATLSVRRYVRSAQKSAYWNHENVYW